MRYTTSSILALAASSLPAAMGVPHPQMFICTTGTNYVVDSQEDVPGPAQVGGFSVHGTSGEATLTQETTYSVGVTIEVGAELGLDFEGIAASISGSVATTTETGTTSGASDKCPQGEWYCALSITPTMVKVSGKQKNYNSCIEGEDEGKPYTVMMPKLNTDKNPFISAEVCTCHNLPHWADPGHPGLLCPEDCAEPSA